MPRGDRSTELTLKVLVHSTTPWWLNKQDNNNNNSTTPASIAHASVDSARACFCN